MQARMGLLRWLWMGVLAAGLVACQTGSGGPGLPATVPPVPSAARVSAEGAIQITVRPLNLQSPGETLDFEVALDTHTVDLAFDLAALAVLRNDEGRVLQALSWDGGRGGHHLRGRLSFPARDAAGVPLIGERTRYVELILRDVGGVPERIFRWEVRP